MNNPEVVRFTNEVVRPMAEKMRSIVAEIDAALLRWESGVGALVSADLKELVEDGREHEGISRLTCNDIALLVQQMAAVQAAAHREGTPLVLAKPCVRPLRAE